MNLLFLDKLKMVIKMKNTKYDKRSLDYARDKGLKENEVFSLLPLLRPTWRSLTSRSKIIIILKLIIKSKL